MRISCPGGRRAKNWEQSLKWRRLAVEDGITVMVATRTSSKGDLSILSQVNDKEIILQHVAQLRQKLSEAQIPLEIIPGCDFPLGFESLILLDEGRALTINDANRYLLLELPDTSLPPAIEEICFPAIQA
jgi:protein-tyrosine phosphatase